MRKGFFCIADVTVLLRRVCNFALEGGGENPPNAETTPEKGFGGFGGRSNLPNGDGANGSELSQDSSCGLPNGSGVLPANARPRPTPKSGDAREPCLLSEACATAEKGPLPPNSTGAVASIVKHGPRGARHITHCDARGSFTKVQEGQLDAAAVCAIATLSVESSPIIPGLAVPQTEHMPLKSGFTSVQVEQDHPSLAPAAMADDSTGVAGVGTITAAVAAAVGVQRKRKKMLRTLAR